jgi:hypothetical protein
MYYWEDKNTGYGIDVLRSFKDYQQPPEESELPEEERGKERDWKRLLNSTPTVTRAPGFGRKGHW